MFNTIKKDNNYIKQNEFYYHKELKLINDLPVVNYDLDRGTIVSRNNEYFVERVASYTLQDFTRYFYNVMPIDMQANPPSKMLGMFKYKINQYGIDKLLFMVDIMAEDCKDKNKLFNIGSLDDYSCAVNDHIQHIKNSLSEQKKKEYYVQRKRRLF